MAVSIRMARYGKKNEPMYRIIAIDKRRAHHAECLENLGTYNPIKGKFVQFHVTKLEAWVAKGAQMTDTVAKLYRLHKKGAGSAAVKAAAPVAPAPKAVANEAVEPQA